MKPRVRSLWNCNSCQQILDPPRRLCPSCNKPTRIPSNIIYAGEDNHSLKKRFHTLRQQWTANSAVWRRLSRYRRKLEEGIAVSLNLHPETIISILTLGYAGRIINYHDALQAQMNVTYDPDLAAKRRGIDNLAFGDDGEKLTYGTVNLGTIGLFSYGAACVFLKSEIKDRVSFLEENSFNYAHRSGAGHNFNIPPGARALWHTVATLALVKHQTDLLTKEWTNDELARLILSCNGNKETDRFIEAQIYPPVTPELFAKILYDPSIPRPAKPGTLIGELSEHSRTLFAELLVSLAPRGIPVEIIKTNKQEGIS